MKRPWVPVLEALLLLGVLAWVAFALLRPEPGPAGGIDLKVQLVDARDRVWLHRGDDGALRYQVTRADGAVEQLTPQAFSERLHREQSSRGALASALNVSSPVGFAWVAVGFLGQLLFTGRMLVSRAGGVFDASGSMVDEAVRTQLRGFLQGFAGFVDSRRKET